MTERNQPEKRLWLRAILALALLGGSGSQALAQPGVAPGGDAAEADTNLEGVYLPADREIRRKFERASESLQERRFAEGVQLLDEILKGPEDYFFKPDDKQPVYRSLKTEAERLLGQMPSGGHEAYELQFGADARRLLVEANAAGDLDKLAQVSRRFFHTKAGYEATFVVARNHLDHGRPLAAALCLKRIQDTPSAATTFEPTLSVTLATCWLRANMPERAIETLVALKVNSPRVKIRVGDKDIALFTRNDDALDWLQTVAGKPRESRLSDHDQWTMFRGDPSRNAASRGDRPLLHARWRVPTPNDRNDERLISQLRQQLVDQNQTPLPSTHPLAVRAVDLRGKKPAAAASQDGERAYRDVVLMRTSRSLLAVDFATGKRIWEARNDDRDDVSPPALTANQTVRIRQQVQETQGLTERLWDNATYGTMSSDGRHVYTVEDLEANWTNVGRQRQVVMNNGVRRLVIGGPQLFNRLAARELESEGKLKWQIGGATGDYEPQLAEVFFLGPPLPLLGQLYVLGELKGEIRLLVLNSETGALEWSQQLAVVEQNIQHDPFRKVTGVSPSFSDGVLICPTSAGAVVAVDLTTRSLLWGYQYPRANTDFFPVIGGRGGMMFSIEGADGLSERWPDGCATMAGDHVVITPAESAELHCLNLLDGRQLWKIEKSENLYVAGIHKDQVILVGRRQVQAYRVADGKPAWSEEGVALPQGSIPSGRGFASNEHYYLPLSTAEVVKIDLSKGAIVDRAKSRKGNIPGNLICYKNEVISQGVDYLETFYQLEPLKERIASQLEKNPRDAEALARRGEIQLAEGNTQAAVADLRASYDREARADTRDLLVEALIELLKTDFVANRESLPELEKLIERPSERATYLRVLTTGLQSAGDTGAALKACLELAELGWERKELEAIDPKWSVRRDRWIQARLKEIWASANAEQRAGIEAAVQSRLDRSLKSDDVAALRQFLDNFGTLPAADMVREQLAQKLTPRDSLLEKVQLLRRVERSSDPQRSRAATARMAKWLLEENRSEEAAWYYRKLAGELADQVCLNGKTGRELARELPTDSPVRALLEGPAAWPLGKVNAAPPARSGGRPIFRQFIEWRGACEPFLENTNLSLDQQLVLVARDGCNRERWRIPLNERGQGIAVSGEPGINYAGANGHLVVFTLGLQVVAVDTLRTSASGDKILWRQDMLESMPRLYGRRQMQARQVFGGWRATRFTPTDEGGRPLGTTGPITDHGVFLQRSRDLYALDPYTGETLWTRNGLEPGCELFGDDDVLIAAPPEAADATVVRSLDGQLLGRCSVPPAEQRVMTLGRRVLVWRTSEEGKPELALNDPWSQQDLWKREFSPGSQWALLGREAVGVMQPDGRFALLSLADGRALVDEKLEAEEALSNIYLLPSRDQFFLLTNRPPSKPNPKIAYMTVLPSNDQLNPIISGRVYAFDRATGKPSWPVSAVVEQHGVLLNQPQDMPILAFARQVHDSTQREGGTKTSVLCLDKLTGRLVYPTELPMRDLPTRSNSSVDYQVDPEKRQLSLTVLGNEIKLTYSNDPVAPSPPYQALATERKPAKGVLEVMEKTIKALGRSIQGAPPADE